MAANRKVSIIGLGYVGLPLAVAFGKHGRVIGFDLNTERIGQLKQNKDKNNDVPSDDLKTADIQFTHDPLDLKQADFHIVAVPTPVDESKKPDLSLILGASETLGKVLKKGDIVVYESTVYPGATEEDCLPVLERVSGLKAGKDFKLGYSPERINPGDKEHRLETIIKVVAGQDPACLDIVASVYGTVAKAGVYRASSIRVAEAAKVIENTQRDLNIALMNELAIIFQRMGLDTQEVLEAAGTKWNFLKFKPGLVGGHCIGVDPYYLTHKAEKVGYIPQVILAGRRINDNMGRYVAGQTVKQLAKAGHPVPGCTVTVLGLTFKENCSDLRNSRVVDILGELREYGVKIQVCDPLADPKDALKEYGVELVPEAKLQKADALILAVAHQTFASWKAPKLLSLLNHTPLVMDIKSLFDPVELAAAGIRLWRL